MWLRHGALDRAFVVVVRSFVCSRVAVSLSVVAVTMRPNRNMETAVDLPLLSRHFSSCALSFAPAFACLCVLHAGGSRRRSISAVHAGPEGCVVHRSSRWSGLRRVDFRSGEGMLDNVWVVVSVVWRGCVHVGFGRRRHEI